jgi:hypothetical protein
MIMKNKLHLLLLASMALLIAFSGCKKSDVSDWGAQLSTHTDDQSRFSNESDAVDNDANVIIDASAAFNGKVEGLNSIICDATVVLDSTVSLRRIIITYNGTNCLGTRTRTGVVVLTIPIAQHWVDAGAVLTMNIQNLHITRLSDNKSITINGTRTLTNVTGGRLRDLASLGTIIHDVASAGMQITFDDGTQRSWQVAKRRTFTYNNGIVVSTVGTHTDGINTGIGEWGTNRYGNTFFTIIDQPMIIRQDCDFRLVSGQVTHKGLLAEVVVTFGLDANGNATSCPGAGASYYYKLVWTGANGGVRTVILPY